LDLELRKKLVKCCIWSIALYGAETWMLQAVDQKHLEGFEMWCIPMPEFKKRSKYTSTRK
jgi:hypothetical protein